MEKDVKLLKVLFPDSKLPEQLKLVRTKLGYLLQFGLAATFVLILITPSCWFCTKICIFFREAFNYISKRKQMGAHVFYFHEEKQLDFISDHIFWVMLMQKRHFSQYRQFMVSLIWRTIWCKFQWTVQMWTEKQ